MKQNADMKEGAEIVVVTCLGVRRGEQVAIVADMPNERVGFALAAVAKQQGAEVSLVFIEPRKAHAEDPPRPVINALCGADAAILATTFSMSNSNARRLANKAGARIISLPGCRAETLTSGAIFADFRAMEPIVRKLGACLSGANLVHITTRSGTDLIVRLCGRKSVDQIGMAHQPGSWAPCPNLETAVGPHEEGVDGVFIVDGAVVPGGVPREPVVVTFRQGKAQKIEGGQEASALRDILERFENPNMYQVVEFGIGLNKEAHIGRGLMAEDEGQFGTVHLGLGEGRTFGLAVQAPSHIDLVVRQPVVTIDDRRVLADEQFTAEFLAPGFGDKQQCKL